MNIHKHVILTVVVFGISSRVGAADSEPLYGFSSAGSEAEIKLEKAFCAMPDPEHLRQYMQRLAARPHHVGSAYDRKNADWIADQMTSWGWDASIEVFEVLFPTPKTRLLEMTEPEHFTASLQEPPVGVDPTSGQTEEQLPTYNAYSCDGDVSGPLVFVNYGTVEDYKELDRLGVSVKGAVVIAKYGKVWRGIKPKVAAEHGAVGCIIYSDPKDDGYSVDDVFPEGPMRNSNGVQRGSVMDFPSSNPGDPLTPGVGALSWVRRLPLKEAKSITKIPVLPISYGDALPMLGKMTGPVAPEAWRGTLPITYHIGPGAAKVHLKVAFKWSLKPVFDVIGRIQGSTAGDEWVIRGNHHDGWVNGADDPISAQVCLLEEARALGTLVKQGWKPRRTIIYCAWDGEEPMLLGSTEWVETHVDELRDKGVAYLNTDSNRRGFLMMNGCSMLEHFINDVARDIEDPETKITAWKRCQDYKISQATTAAERSKLREHSDLPIEPLGSGSDYTAFVDYVGIPCLDVGYEWETHSGVYHSIYDDFYWCTHFGDTNFVYGRTLAQTVGTAVLRLADADVIPYEFTDLADTVNRFTEEVQALLKHKQEDIEERNRELEGGVYAAISDPWHPTRPPEAEATPPDLNFAPLLNAGKALSASAKRYQKAFASAQGGFGDPAQKANVEKLNRVLLGAERAFTDPAGLLRRSWYKNLLYGPGVYTGYGVKTLPGVREGIEQGHYAEAESEAVRVAKVLDAETALLDKASAILERIGH